MSANQFIRELQRRNVPKAAVAYIAVSWLALQAASIIFPALNAPKGAIRYLLTVLLVLFPFWIIFAWIYEYTPQGFKKTKDDTTGERGVEAPVNQMNKVIIASLGLAVLLLLADRIFGLSENLLAVESEKSVAVLPFANLSTNEENQWFCDGIMMATYNQISKFKDIHVISPTSVEQYRNNPPQISVIAKQLNVDFLVGGGVQRAGNQALIFVQLVQASADKILWSDNFDFDVTDLFAVQAEITKIIARNTGAFLSVELGRQIDKVPTTDPLAYDYYLQGNNFFESISTTQQTRDVWVDLYDKALTFYQLALDRDSLFADPYMGIAKVIRNTGIPLDPSLDVQDESLIYVNKALDINPDLAEAYIVRSRIYSRKSLPELSITDLRKCLELDPNNIEAMNRIAFITRYDQLDFVGALRILQEIEKRIRSEEEQCWLYNVYSSIMSDLGDLRLNEYYVNKCLTLNPTLRMPLIFHYTVSGRFGEAVEMVEELFPNQTIVKLVNLGNLSAYRGDSEKALEYYRQMEQLIGDRTMNNWVHRALNIYAYLLLVSGEVEKANQIFDQNIEYFHSEIEKNALFSDISSRYGLASIQAARGDIDGAFEWFEQLRSVDGWMKRGFFEYTIYFDVTMEGLRQDPRFDQMMAQVKAEKDSVRNEVREYLGFGD